MDSYNIAEAKANLSALIERAAAGEEIEIRKRGRPVATLGPARQPREPLDIDKLRALTDKMKPSRVSGVELLREMRDSRY